MITLERRLFIFTVFVLVLVLFSTIIQWRRALRAVTFPTPTAIEIASCEDLITMPTRFHGKVVQTTGYIRLATLLQNYFAAERGSEGGDPFANTPDHLVMYALTPQPLPKDWHSDGGTIGRLFTTNLLVETYDALPNRLTMVNATSSTPRITVVGRFQLSGETRRLQLHYWLDSKADR
jgi:hypothetical protein